MSHAPSSSCTRESAVPARRMFPQNIIIKKRDGGALTKEEIEFFARGVSDGKGFADYQATALLMELVRGVTLTDYCDAQQLATRDRLELFIPVCQAVQHGRFRSTAKSGEF